MGLCRVGVDGITHVKLRSHVLARLNHDGFLDCPRKDPKAWRVLQWLLAPLVSSLVQSVLCHE
jgi:hypothetical protein